MLIVLTGPISVSVHVLENFIPIGLGMGVVLIVTELLRYWKL